MRNQPVSHSLPDPAEVWLARIGLAMRIDEVVELAREYVAELTESERMRLPSSCLPPSLKNAREVNDYALTLTRAQLAFRGPLASSLVLQRMTQFFATVSGRIAQIEHAARPRVPTPEVKERTRW